MSLVSQLTLAFQRVGAEFKSVRAALLTKQMLLTAVVSTTAPTTPTAGNYYQINATTPQAVTLPTSTKGDVIGFMQSNLTTAGTNTITLNGTINGVANAGLVLSLSNEAKIFIADQSGGWAVYSSNYGKGALDARYLQIANVVQGSNISITNASGVLTIGVSGLITPAISTVPYAATIAVNAASATVFRVTMTGNLTLAAPTNPTEGQRIEFELTASGAARTIAWASGATGFKFGTTVPAPTTVAQNTTTVVGATYRTSTNAWDVRYVDEGF